MTTTLRAVMRFSNPSNPSEASGRVIEVGPRRTTAAADRSSSLGHPGGLPLPMAHTPILLFVHAERSSPKRPVVVLGPVRPALAKSQPKLRSRGRPQRPDLAATAAPRGVQLVSRIAGLLVTRTA
jgi:hypothetical protein